MPTAPFTLPTLEGRYVRLEPLDRSHALGLLDAADEATFEYMPLAPATWDAQGFAEYAGKLLDYPGLHPLAVISKANERVAGTSSYLSVTPEYQGIEIGMTWIGPASRGTAVNPEMKRLMLAHAFETDLFEGGPAIRVQFKTDARNTRSRAAIAKLGAVFEGVLRNQMVLQDGHFRDSPLFSITDDEWPSVRAGLDDRLAAFDEA